MDYNIIEILKKNEYSFCKCWSNLFFNIDNDISFVYNTDLYDDYFLNRVLISEKFRIEADKKIDKLLSYSKKENLVLYIHVNSNNILSEEFLRSKNFTKIDEVIGLQYDYNSYDCESKNFSISLNQDLYENYHIMIVNSCNDLSDWLSVYCDSFDIESKTIREKVFQIIKNNSNKFLFVLLKKNDLNEKKIESNSLGCCILFPSCGIIGLYCLGTKKEFRKINVASRIIDFSVKYGKGTGYQFFGLQTLKSDNLLSFYYKRRFKKIYTDSVFTFQS